MTINISFINFQCYHPRKLIIHFDRDVFSLGGGACFAFYMCDFNFIVQPGCSCILAGDINQIAVHLVTGLGIIRKIICMKIFKSPVTKTSDHVDC